MLFLQILNLCRIKYPTFIGNIIDRFNPLSLKSYYQKIHSAYYEIAGFPDDYRLVNASDNVYHNQTSYYCYGNVYEEFQVSVIDISGRNNVTILIEECMFKSVSSSEVGGAIAFNCPGQVHQNRICSIKCSSKSGHHAYIISSSENAKHSISETTITDQNDSDNPSSLWMQNYINMKTTNFSKLIMPRYSSFTFRNIKSAVLRFCTIAKTIVVDDADNSFTLYCGSEVESDFNVEYSNIIGNVYPKHGANFQCDVTITKCSIYSNTAKNGNENGFFARDSERGTLIIDNTYYDGHIEDNYTILQAQDKFINVINFLNLGDCKGVKIHDAFDNNCAPPDEEKGKEQLLTYIVLFLL